MFASPNHAIQYFSSLRFSHDTSPKTYLRNHLRDFLFDIFLHRKNERKKLFLQGLWEGILHKTQKKFIGRELFSQFIHVHHLSDNSKHNKAFSVIQRGDVSYLISMMQTRC